MKIFTNHPSSLIERPCEDHTIESLKKGFRMPLSTVYGCGDTLLDCYNNLPTEVTFRSRIYRKSYAYRKDTRGYAVYLNPENPEDSIPRVGLTYSRILAEDWFGRMFNGVDSYLAEFSKFIGINVDAYNIQDHFNSFSAYMAKECNEEINKMRYVLRFIFNMGTRA